MPAGLLTLLRGLPALPLGLQPRRLPRHPKPHHSALRPPTHHHSRTCSTESPYLLGPSTPGFSLMTLMVKS